MRIIYAVAAALLLATTWTAEATTQSFIAQSLSGNQLITIASTDTSVIVRDCTISGDLRIKPASSAALQPTLEIIVEDNVLDSAKRIYIGREDFTMIGGSIKVTGNTAHRFYLGYASTGTSMTMSLTNVNVVVADNTLASIAYICYTYSSGGSSDCTFVSAGSNFLLTRNTFTDFYFCYAFANNAPDSATSTCTLSGTTVDVLSNSGALGMATARDGSCAMTVTSSFVTIEDNRNSAEVIAFGEAVKNSDQSPTTSLTFVGTRVKVHRNHASHVYFGWGRLGSASTAGASSTVQFTSSLGNELSITGNVLANDIRFAHSSAIGTDCTVNLNDVTTSISGNSVGSFIYINYAFEESTSTLTTSGGSFTISNNTAGSDIRMGYGNQAGCEFYNSHQNTAISLSRNIISDNIYVVYGFSKAFGRWSMTGGSLKVNENTVSTSNIRTCYAGATSNPQGRIECSFTQVNLQMNGNNVPTGGVLFTFASDSHAITTFTSGALEMNDNTANDGRIGYGNIGTSRLTFASSTISVSKNHFLTSFYFGFAQAGPSHLSLLDCTAVLDGNTVGGELRVGYGYLAGSMMNTTLDRTRLVISGNTVTHVRVNYAATGGHSTLDANSGLIAILGNIASQRIYLTQAFDASSVVQATFKETNATISGNTITESLQVVTASGGTATTTASLIDSFLDLSSNTLVTAGERLYLCISLGDGDTSLVGSRSSVTVSGNSVGEMYVAYAYQSGSTAILNFESNVQMHVLSNTIIGGSLYIGYGYEPTAVVTATFSDNSDLLVAENVIDEHIRLGYGYNQGTSNVIINNGGAGGGGSSGITFRRNSIGQIFSYGFATIAGSTSTVTQSDSQVVINENTIGQELRFAYVSLSASSTTSLTNSQVEISQNTVNQNLLLAYSSSATASNSVLFPGTSFVIRENRVGGSLRVLREVGSELTTSLSRASFSLSHNHVGALFEFLTPSGSLAHDYSLRMEYNNLTLGSININVWRIPVVVIDQNSLGPQSGVILVGEMVRAGSLTIPLNRFMGCNFFPDKSLAFTTIANFTHRTNCVFSRTVSRTLTNTLRDSSMSGGSSSDFGSGTGSTAGGSSSTDISPSEFDLTGDEAATVSSSSSTTAATIPSVFRRGEVKSFTFTGTYQVSSSALASGATVSCSVISQQEEVLYSDGALHSALTLSGSSSTTQSSGSSFTLALSFLVVDPSGGGTLQCTAAAGATTPLTITINFSLQTVTSTQLPLIDSAAPLVDLIQHSASSTLEVDLTGRNLGLAASIPSFIRVGPYVAEVTPSSSASGDSASGKITFPPALTCSQVLAMSSPFLSFESTNPSARAFAARLAATNANLQTTVSNLCSGKSADFLLSAHLFHWDLWGNSTLEYEARLVMDIALFSQQQSSTSSSAVTQTAGRKMNLQQSSSSQAVIQSGNSFSLEAGGVPATPIQVQFAFFDPASSATVPLWNMGIIASANSYSTLVGYESTLSSPDQLAPSQDSSPIVTLANISAAASTPAGSNALQLFVQRTWGGRRYKSSVGITVTRPSIQLQLYHTSRWVVKYRLFVPTGTARSVSFTVSPNAPISLLLATNYSRGTSVVISTSHYCTTDLTTGWLKCFFAELPAGELIVYSKIKQHSGASYFNGEVTLEYELSGSNTDNSVRGSMVVSSSTVGSQAVGNVVVASSSAGSGSGSASSLGTVVATPSPITTSPLVGGSDPVAAASRRGIFGRTEGAMMCADALFLTIFACFLDILLVLVFYLAVLKKSEADDGNEYWEDIPVWRSALVQHAWFAIPCHSQCAMAHAFQISSHVLALLAFSTVMSVAFVSASETVGFIFAAFGASILASGLRPIPAFFYAYYKTEEAGHEKKFTNKLDREEGSQDDVMVPTTPSPRAGGLVKSKSGFGTFGGSFAVKMKEVNVALDEISLASSAELNESLEFDDDDGPRTPAAAAPDATLPDGDEMAPKQEKSPAAVPHASGEEAEKELEVQDDVVELHRDITQAKTQYLGTVARLKEGVDELEATHGPNGSSERESSSFGEEEEEEGPLLAKTICEDSRRKGHIINLVLSVMMIVIALVTLGSGIDTDTKCSGFERSYIFALFVDIFIVQPAIVGLTLVYRCLSADDEVNNGEMWSELHPFHGAIRPVNS